MLAFPDALFFADEEVDASAPVLGVSELPLDPGLFEPAGLDSFGGNHFVALQDGAAQLLWEVRF
jgi:hypothetical protein